MTSAEKHYQKMTQTPASRLVLQLGIPTTVSMLITSIYNMADTYFVGSIGPSAQAATGVLFTLQAIIQGLGFMYGQGCGTFISKELAKRDTDSASVYISSTLFAGFLTGMCILLCGMLFRQPLVLFLGSTRTILPHAMDYCLWVLLACPLVICSLILNNGLRFEGKSLYAMFGLTAGGLLNIAADYLFVMRLHMGVFGAGLATALSQCISFLILLAIYIRTAQSRISLKYLSKSLGLYLSVARVGIPSLIRQSLTSVTNGVLNNLTKPFGDAAIAAMSVVGRYSFFLACLGLGMGQGFQPVASFNYQAGKRSRVRQGLLFTMGYGVVVIGGAALASIFFAEPIIRLFQKSPEVVAIGSTALRLYAVGIMFTPFSIPVNMLYQSIQKPGIASALSLIRAGAVTIPILLLGVPLFGLAAVQCAQPIADVLAGLVSIPFIIYFCKNSADVPVAA